MRPRLTIALLVLLATGCAAWLPDAEREAAPRYASAEDHLRFLDRLASADDAEMAVIDAALRAAVEADGESADRRLRRAFWLARPGHDEHDPEAALVLFSELASAQGGITPASRALVRYQREQLARMRVLQAERDEFEARVRALTAIEEQIDGGFDDPADPDTEP